MPGFRFCSQIVRVFVTAHMGGVRWFVHGIMHAQKIVTIQTKGRGFTNLTENVREFVSSCGVQTGLCVVFVRHTSASLVIQENADPAVLRDLQCWIDSLAPESRHWEHRDEGPDDMPSHARSAVTKTSETVPIIEGKLALGIWQGVFLWEHREAPHRREVVLHVWGE